MCNPAIIPAIGAWVGSNAIPLGIAAAGAGASMYGSRQQMKGQMQNEAARYNHDMAFLNEQTRVQNDATARSTAAGQSEWNREQARQRAMDAERQGLLGEVMDNSTGQELYEQKMDASRAEREQGYEDNRAERGEYGAVPVSGGSTANRVVQQAAEAEQTKRDENLSGRLSAQAGLSSLGDTIQQLDLWRRPYSDRIRASQVAARNSAGIADSERNAAMNLAGVPDRVVVRGMTPFRGGSKMALGDALVGVGNAAMSYGGGQLGRFSMTPNTNVVNAANPAANVNDAWLHNSMSSPYMMR